MVSLEIPDDEDLDGSEILKILGYSQLRTRPSHLEPVILSRDVDHKQWQAALRKREAKASRITDALRRGSVEVHFQPVIELATRDLYNVEVLARIRTDEGLMTATEFIDSVYQLGEIVELDSQVFKRLGEVASEIAGITGHLFINVSPISLLSPDFLDIMSRTMTRLHDEGLGMVVVLELTEQAIVEHLDIIHELHTRHDVKFAVDDFGTGYSSLKTVSDLATSKVISHLKLDGSLIKEIEKSSEAYKVVLAIANLAKSLDLTVVAEHVESEAVLDRLRTIGVDLGQGELFDMPLPLLGLLDGYRDRPASTVEPIFSRPDFEKVVPYLDKAFQGFYERLLSNEHFSAFFQDAEQIRSLVDRQRASFVESMTENDEQLRDRYISLGRMHYRLGVPFPSFMKGTEILNEELLAVLAHVDDHGTLVFQSSLFFKRLQNLLARGYLDGIVAEEETELAASLDGVRAALSTARAPSLDWIGDLVEAVRLDSHDSPPRPEIAVGDAVEWLQERVAPLLTKDSANSILDAYRALHADGDSLAFFLGEQEYASVLLLYRQVHDRVVTLQRSLSEAGLA
jgi:EAL domain-containing protein (putative c-di-GMP-specific phosphodiesterase class I)